jgi:hypothetical protein
MERGIVFGRRFSNADSAGLEPVQTQYLKQTLAWFSSSLPQRGVFRIVLLGAIRWYAVHTVTGI